MTGTIRLFDKKDFYAAYGEDALYGRSEQLVPLYKLNTVTAVVAENVYHTTTVLKQLGAKGNKKGLSSCTLSRAVAIHFLREALTSRQLRIEIYAPSSSSSAKTSAAWVLDKAASPGNLQDVEDLLFANSDILESPMSLSIIFKVKDGQKNVGIAFADSNERKLGVSEFVETDIFSNLEVGRLSLNYIHVTAAHACTLEI